LGIHSDGEAMKNLVILLIVIMLSGCLEKPATEIMNCGGGEPADNKWWGDSHQWNSLPMSYGNATNWTMNNSSDGLLHLSIDVEAYFSEAVGPLGQGYLNISVTQNETLWENQTSENRGWNVSIPVNTSQEVWIELKATGKDTYPDNEYGDYFIAKLNGKTMTPEWCH